MIVVVKRSWTICWAAAAIFLADAGVIGEIIQSSAQMIGIASFIGEGGFAVEEKFFGATGCCANNGPTSGGGLKQGQGEGFFPFAAEDQTIKRLVYLGGLFW